MEEEKREWENATRLEYKLCFTEAINEERSQNRKRREVKKWVLEGKK